MAFMILLLAAIGADGQLHVGAHSMSNVVRIAADGTLSGYEVELVRDFAESQGLEVVFHPEADFTNLIQHTVQQRYACSIGGISVTAARESELDFTVPTLETGISLLVRPRPQPWLDALRDLSRAVLPSTIGLLLFVTIGAHLVWLSERTSNADFASSYWTGIGDSIWFVFVLIVSMGFAEKFTKRSWGRVVTALIMLGWMFTAANLYSDLSAFKLSRKPQPDFAKLSELKGRKIATKPGTTSAVLLQRQGAIVVPVSEIEHGVKLLTKNQVDGVVFDSIALAENARDESLMLLPLINEQALAIALPQGSELREPLNRFLLQRREDGRLAELKRRHLSL